MNIGKLSGLAAGAATVLALAGAAVPAAAAPTAPGASAVAGTTVVSPHGLVQSSKSFTYGGKTCRVSITLNTSGSNVVSYSSVNCDVKTFFSQYNQLGINAPLDKQSSRSCGGGGFVNSCGAPDLSEKNPSGSQKFCGLALTQVAPGASGLSEQVSVCTYY